MPTPYAFDPTGTLLANRITGEQHILTGVADRNFHFIVPTYAPFFAESCTISYRDIDNNIRFLVEGIDFYFTFQFIAASRSCAKPIYGGISFLNTQLAGVVTLVYQTVGGIWTIDAQKINEILSDTQRNPRVTSWETVAGVPTLFPVVDHEWNLTDLVGMSEVEDAINTVAQTIADKPAPPPLDLGDLVVTKESVGLGNVQNFAVASDQQAIDGVSITRYMTPRAVKVAIDFAIDAIFSGLNSLAQKTGALLVGTATNQTLDKAVLFVKTTAELRSLDAPTADAAKTYTVLMLGNTNAGDISPVVYHWVSNSTLDHNGYTVISPTSAPAQGRWIHQDADAYTNQRFTATSGQTAVALTTLPYTEGLLRVVLNNTEELLYRIDYHIQTGQLVFNTPLTLGTVVDIAIQSKPIVDARGNMAVYNKFTVATPSDVFTLTQTPVNPQAYCVLVNDETILFHNAGFTLVNNQLTIQYPIVAGNVVEFIPHFHPSGLPYRALKQVKALLMV
jgi:hypothetical protein